MSAVLGFVGDGFAVLGCDSQYTTRETRTEAIYAKNFRDKMVRMEGGWLSGTGQTPLTDYAMDRLGPEPAGCPAIVAEAIVEAAVEAQVADVRSLRLVQAWAKDGRCGLLDGGLNGMEPKLTKTGTVVLSVSEELDRGDLVDLQQAVLEREDPVEAATIVGRGILRIAEWSEFVGGDVSVGVVTADGEMERYTMTGDQP